jgi:predicted alpha/beta hydrolase family esterase
MGTMLRALAGAAQNGPAPQHWFPWITQKKHVVQYFTLQTWDYVGLRPGSISTQKKIRVGLQQ